MLRRNVRNFAARVSPCAQVPNGGTEILSP